MQNKVDDIIQADLLEDIVKKLPTISAFNNPDTTVLICGMGGQPRSFYRQLRNNPDVELLWTGWSSNAWWTYLLSFIPGQAGLAKVLNREKVFELYEDIGGMSYCGLYFFENKFEQQVVELIKKDRGGSDLPKLFENEQNYFLLNVDFDYHGGDRDGEVFYKGLCYDDKLNSELATNLTRANVVADESLNKV